ncbi:MAG TPA: hypothetical protein VMK13_07150 [Streptosporangiaceae bacterium]|nr:hypothetical protein [Streptosporangiaceae bacterium]
MAEQVRVCKVDDERGQRRLRITRSGAGPAAAWRRARMALLPAPGMPGAKIAEVTFTSRTGSGR